MISVRVPEVARAWAYLRTKDSDALHCRFLGKKGQFNLSQIELFGETPAIHQNRSNGDVVEFLFKHNEHIHAPRLKEVLAEHLRGFRESFAKSGA